MRHALGRPFRADLVADPVERRELARRELARALDDRVDQVGLASAKALCAGQLVDPDDMLEQETLFGGGRRIGHGSVLRSCVIAAGYSAAAVTPPNPPFATEIRPYGEAAIAEAARLIGEGQLVAVPTETVYGLAADATDGAAVARIYAAKGRPSFNPLIVHVRVARRGRGRSPMFDAARARSGRALLAGAADPGAAARAGRSRSPRWSPPACRRSRSARRAHPAMRDLLAAAGRPLAAPSANASGRISPTRAEHVLASLGGRIPLIVDGGATAHGLESTIVAVGDGMAAPAAARPDRRSRLWARPCPMPAERHRGAGPAGQPLCARQAAAARRDATPRPTNG